MIFWIIVVLIGLGLYFLNQNKTEKKDRTTITHKNVIQTDDGEVHIERRQVIDSVRTAYTKKDLAQGEIASIKPTIEHNPVSRYSSTHTSDVLSKPDPVSTLQTINPEQPPNAIIKICQKCNKGLDDTAFAQSSKNDDGLTKWCISCLNQLNEDRKNQSSNKQQCPNCKKNRLKTSFYKNSKQPDGLTKWCKDCMDKSKK